MELFIVAYGCQRIGITSTHTEVQLCLPSHDKISLQPHHRLTAQLFRLP